MVVMVIGGVIKGMLLGMFVVELIFKVVMVSMICVIVKVCYVVLGLSW